jgi:hypothetical protein
MSSGVLDPFVQDTGSGVFVPRAVINPIPYTDLNATDPPVARPQISPDLLSALAILVAQSPQGPKLLRSATDGRLRTLARLNTSTFLTDVVTAGATTLNVDDTTEMEVGDQLTLVSKANPAQTCPQCTVLTIPDIHTVTIVNTCATFSWVPGDRVIVEQVVDIRAIIDTVKLEVAHWNNAFGSSGTSKGALWGVLDNRGFTSLMVRDQGMPALASTAVKFGATTVPSIGFGASTGIALSVRSWAASIANFTPAGNPFSVDVVIASTGGTPATLWGEALAISAAVGGWARVGSDSPNLTTNPGQGITLSIPQTVPANAYAWLALAIDFC